MSTLSLASLPVASIALALGICVGQPQRTAATGRVSALCDELRRRGVWPDLLASLDPELADSIVVLDMADRGQSWSRSGQRQPRSP